MNKKYDFLVFIGRFQPFHSGHLKVVEKALSESNKLIMLLGSAHQPRNLRNPWTFDERDQMIRNSLQLEDATRVITAPLMDVMYNDELWVKNVQSTVNGLVTAHHATIQRQAKVGLIGHSKDHSSYYLNLFPQWGSVPVEDYKNIDATPLRHAYISSSDNPETLINTMLNKELLPEGTVHFLHQFYSYNSDDFVQLHSEHHFIEKYKSAWSKAPYAPTFVTVDAVVVQSGHLLVVERKARPGKGLLALPGGFINHHESLIDACLRELREETKLKVPSAVLKGCIKDRDVFDDPHRSMRGRTITHAFYIELPPNSTLPKVKGGDDAKSAFWLPLSELNPEVFFEDHYFIIQKMVGKS